MCRAILPVAAFLLCVPLARSAAAEQLPPPRLALPGELLPAPAPIVEIVPMGPALPGYWRRSQYDKWQLYAVDREGFWRPRVILAPQPYFLYNGMPYFWLSVKPLDFVPQ